MRTYNPRLTLSLCALATGLLITACGGGTATPPGTTPLTSGFAIDGYLSGSTVLCDTNDNGAADTGEITTTTDSTGFYKFATECKATVVATGGKSTDTLLDFGGKLKSPAGSTVITPLTTLVASGMTMAQVNTALGLPASTDLLNTDAAAKKDGAYVNGDLFKKTLAVQQLLQQTAAVFANLATSGGDAALPALYSEVAKAMATELKKGTALNAGTTVSETVVNGIVKAAHAQVAASALFSPAVKTGVTAVNADSLAQVTAASLKDQAEGLLKSADTALVEKARTSQSDTQIKSFVSANKIALATGASASNITTLASNLTNQVKDISNGGGSSGGDSTPESGDSLVTFDESSLTWVGFDGANYNSAIVSNAPTGATGKALKIVRDGTREWAGAYVTRTTAIPFTSDRKTISARVYSSKAGIPIKLKIEKDGDSNVYIEVAANETVVANSWQTLTWTFSAASTSSNVQYKTITMLPDLGTLGNGDIYYFDNIRLDAAPAAVSLVTFDETSLTWVGFDGANYNSAIVSNAPTGATGKALKIVRDGTREWAGAYVTRTTAIPFTSDRKTISARVYSSKAGIPIKLKIEKDGDSNVYIEVAANETVVANSWQTLTWTFSAASTSSNVQYKTITMLPDLGTLGNGDIYYFDNMQLD